MSLFSSFLSLFGPDTKPEGSPEQRLASLLMATNSHHAQESARNDTDLVQSTIAACIRAKASERSVLRFLVQEHGNANTNLAQRLTNLLNHPNPVQSSIDFYELASQWHDAAGNAVALLVRDKEGHPIEQYLLPTYLFGPTFKQGNPGPIPDHWKFDDMRTSYAPSQIVIIRNNSYKTGTYRGRGIMQDDELTAKVFDAILRSQLNYFQTGGAPNIALQWPLGSALTIDQIKEYQNLWATRYNPATGTSNIAALPDGGTVVNFGTQEMNYATSRADMRDAIRESFQVPKILLGDTSDVNHNNGQTSLAMFERIAVLRWGQKVAAAYELNFRETIHPKISVTVDPEIKKSFTQLPKQNGVIDTPDVTEFEEEDRGVSQPFN